jgi:DNA processing protein
MLLPPRTLRRLCRNWAKSPCASGNSTPRPYRRGPQDPFQAHEPAPGDSLLDWLALSRIPGLGPVRLAQLLERFGSPQHVFSASRADLLPLPLGEPVRDALLRGPDHRWALEQVHRAEDFGASIVPLDDPLYPEPLRHIPQPPPVLFVTGSVPLLHPRTVAVVGTRAPTGIGAESCGHLARHWAREGIRIVSGLARGIDEIAHRAALEAGSETLAVLGCGLDQLERASRVALSREIARHGAVVTEFPFGDPVTKGNFPRRNRIIAGLSAAVVVAEAGERSGALITARNALEQGREVLACPGPAGWESFGGCFRLLREGASLCAAPEDLHLAMDWEVASPARPAPDGLLNLLTGPGATPEEIAVRMGSSVRDIQIQLVLRELAGEVVRGDGGRWRLSA